MKAQKKYKYEDWWSGKISLIYSTIFLNPVSKDKLPTRVTWEDILKEDIPKIKEKQKEIFNDQVKKYKERFQTTFLSRYNNSRLKELFLEDEKNQCLEMFFGGIPKAYIIRTSHWNVNLESTDLINIQEYIRSVIKNGEEETYDYLLSPHYPNQNNLKVPNQICARSYWEYYEWLLDFEKSIPNLDSQQNLNSENEIIKPRNPYPLIFKDEKSYSLFEELYELIVKGKKKKVFADYCFIYHKLHKKPRFDINSTVTQPAFIAFLIDKYDADISENKLPFKTSTTKENIYTKLINKYK